MKVFYFVHVHIHSHAVLIQTCLYYVTSAAISDDRLIICITKADEMYKRSGPGSSTTMKVKAEVVRNIKSATGLDVSERIIFPVCGEGFLSDLELTGWLRTHSVDDTKPKPIVKAANKALERYGIELPSGEGESQKKVIKALDPKELLNKVEGASGVQRVKLR